jgi:hypothetical protein
MSAVVEVPNVVNAAGAEDVDADSEVHAPQTRKTSATRSDRGRFTTMSLSPQNPWIRSQRAQAVPWVHRPPRPA